VSELLPTFDERASLEDRALKARAQLVRTLDALDVRRQQIAHTGRALQRLVIPVAAVLVGVVVVGASSTIAIRVATTRKAARALPRRIGTALEPVRRALFGNIKPSIPWEVLRKVTVVAAGVVATEIAKRTMKKSFDGKPVLPVLRRSPSATSTNAPRFFRAPPKSENTTDGNRRVVVVESDAPRWAAATRKRHPRTTRGVMR